MTPVRVARWAFAAGSTIFLVAAVVPLAAGDDPSPLFLVLAMAFLVIAIGIGRRDQT